MFFDDQNVAFTNLRTALKPGGRIVLLVWQVLENNEWLTELRRALAIGRDLPTPPVGTPGPFGLADPDHTRDLLARTGYTSIRIEDARPPMRVANDVESAYAFLSRIGNTRGLLDDLGADDRIAALNNLRSVLAEHATPQGVVLGTASWLVTATH
jgi:SAM-dependent methyltransferase